MMNEEIGIIIENLEDCITTKKVHIFNTLGGIIGSDPQCAFCVQNKREEIQKQHIKISFEEGFFTISPMQGASVFYGDSFSEMKGDYETVINIGDTFRAGDITFRFASIKEVNELLASNRVEIKDISNDTGMDEIEIKPRGQVKTSDFQEKQNIKEKLLGEKKYDIMENNIDYTEIININKQQTQDFQYANILKALQQSLQDLKSKQKSATLNEYANINIKDFESIIENIPLIKSTRLMNTLVLSLIAKELYSPIFEEMEEDIFIKYLQSAIQGNIKEDKILFENLAIKALENYIKKL